MEGIFLLDPAVYDIIDDLCKFHRIVSDKIIVVYDISFNDSIWLSFEESIVFYFEWPFIFLFFVLRNHFLVDMSIIYYHIVEFCRSYVSFYRIYKIDHFHIGRLAPFGHSIAYIDSLGGR